MTILEGGWNFNHQKSFLRLLRNHGALAALPLHRKIELARFLQGPQLQVGGCGWQIQCCLVWQTSTAGGQAVGTAAAASSHSNCSLHLAVACAYLFRPACPAPPLPCRATGSPTC